MTNDSPDSVQLRIRPRLPLAERMLHEAVPLALVPKVGVVSAKLIGRADGPRRIVCRSDGVSAFRKREERIYVRRYLGRNAKVRGIEGIAWLW